MSSANKVWKCGHFSLSWSQAIVIPIPKPGKDNTEPINYRPIALTSCICKTMERIINKRLVWFLETNNILTNIQCGFRKNRSTINQLVILETFIRDAFVNMMSKIMLRHDAETMTTSCYLETYHFKIIQVDLKN